MNNQDLMDAIMTDDKQVIRDYLMRYGKKPKPISPFILEPLKENKEEERNERT